MTVFIIYAVMMFLTTAYLFHSKIGQELENVCIEDNLRPLDCFMMFTLCIVVWPVFWLMHLKCVRSVLRYIGVQLKIEK